MVFNPVLKTGYTGLKSANTAGFEERQHQFQARDSFGKEDYFSRAFRVKSRDDKTEKDMGPDYNCLQ